MLTWSYKALSNEISLKGDSNATSFPRAKAGNFDTKCPHVDVSAQEYFNQMIHKN